MRNLIIGTAGHVDHGKTEIVKALTGKDTDRLREEKERGISIVLGFAALDLGDGITAGVVDVPGHERFVKNMVSGAVGVDLALLVVAADEGIMPQTEEHLEVLRLLGIDAGVVAITKVDLVDSEIVQLVESEVADLVEGTLLEGSPAVRTSVVTGEGLDELASALKSQAEALREKGRGDFFRMPVDRVFTRSGIGTVVTGTTWGGVVGKGDELVVEPGGRKVRVREVQSFDRSLETGEAHIRAALALHGIKVGEVSVGSQILTPGVLRKSGMLDAYVEVSRMGGSGLKNRQRVRFHHAAAEIMARVVIFGSGKLEEGESGFIQLRLENPAVARRGDRFILRTYSPMRVIAGGRILDPDPPKAKRLKEKTLHFLEKLETGSGREVVLALASMRGTLGVSVGEFRRYGMEIAEADSACSDLMKEGLIHDVGGRIFGAGVLQEKENEMFEVAEEFISKNRLIWGMDREELKDKVGLGNGPLFDFILERGKRGDRFFFKGGRVRAGSGERDLPEGDRKKLEELEKSIKKAGFTFPGRMDLLGAVGDERRLSSLLHILEEDGSIVRVSSGGFIHTEHRNELLERLRLRLKEVGRVSVGDFKDIFGFSRKYAVPLLEYLDREGFTRREGDLRSAGPKLLEEGRDDSIS